MTDVRPPALSCDTLAMPFQSITPLTTPVATRATCYFDQVDMSSIAKTSTTSRISSPSRAVCADAGPQNTSSSPYFAPERSAATLEMQPNDACSSTSDTTCELESTYVLMDITMSVVCDKVALAFFHVVDNDDEDCCNAALSAEVSLDELC
jgi:hypothetical protein